MKIEFFQNKCPTLLKMDNRMPICFRVLMPPDAVAPSIEADDDVDTVFSVFSLLCLLAF